MSVSDDPLSKALLAGIDEQLNDGLTESPGPTEAEPPPRNLRRMMHKISVTLTLEVGRTEISLQELAALGRDSVIELDAIAGDPLTIRVNGTAIGRAEVVVTGDNYGLKIVELHDLDLGFVAQ